MGRPWFKQYPSNYLSGVQRLNLEEIGAYSVVLNLIYDRGGYIQDDPRWISRQCGLNCSTRKWNAIRERLLALGKLQVVGDHLTNPRAKWQLKAEEKEHELLAEAGAKGGRKSAENLAFGNTNNGLAEKGLPGTESEPPSLLDTRDQIPEKLASSARETEVPVIPSGGVLPGLSGSAVALVPEQRAEPKPLPADVFDRARMPRLCDPPHLWIKTVAAKSSKDDWGVARPDIDGWHVDIIAKEVCDAAGMDRPDWKGDWWVLCRWLHDGFRPSHIVAAITDRRGRFGDRWRPPDTLRGLDRVVREYQPKRSAA